MGMLKPSTRSPFKDPCPFGLTVTHTYGMIGPETVLKMALAATVQHGSPKHEKSLLKPFPFRTTGLF